MTGQPIPMTGDAAGMDLGQPVMEPDLESQSRTLEIPKGGEI
jgi:hypothetical protein